MKHICLVTEELVGAPSCGGIGAAIEELSFGLARSGFHVDILFASPHPVGREQFEILKARYQSLGVKLILVDHDDVIAMNSPERRSFAVYSTLKSLKTKYLAIHFHEYHGAAFYSLAAKRHGQAFADTQIVVQLHGCTKFVYALSGEQLAWSDELKSSYLEQKSIEWADYLVSPSAFMLDWLRQNNFKLPAAENCLVIKNAARLAEQFSWRYSTEASPARVFCNEIVFFGRQQSLKGIVEFCKAIGLAKKFLKEHGVSITFLGRAGRIDGTPSAVVMGRLAKDWDLPINIQTNLDRYGALEYLAGNERSLPVICSPIENSPYTVVEACLIGKPLLTSRDGGAPELLDPALHDELLCTIEASAIAAAIERAVVQGMPVARLKSRPEDIEGQWAAFHDGLRSRAAVRSPAVLSGTPKVVFGITHFERPQLIEQAVMSGLRQTYGEIELVVADDASVKPETLDALDTVERILRKAGGRLIRRSVNGYLGATRNTIAENTDSDYLFFLDDDDYALDDAISASVTAATNTGANVIGGLHRYMDASRRYEALSDPEGFRQVLEFFPLGGPLAIAPIENCFCPASALIERKFFEKIGRYSELHSVGFEDYELWVRILQEGGTIEIMPKVTYLYQTGRPSMISTTSMAKNFGRIYRALDLVKRPDEWRDYLSVMMGRMAREHTQGRYFWEIRDTPVQQAFANLWNDEYAADKDRCYDAASVCDFLGASGMADAWRAAAEPRPKDPGRAGAARRRAASPAKASSLLDRALSEAILGRASSFAELYRQHLGRLSQLDHEAAGACLLAARHLSRTDKVEDAELAELIDDVVAFGVADEAMEGVLFSGLAALANACDRPSLARVLTIAAERDESGYFDRYPDVATAMKRAPDTAMAHFDRYGSDEGRQGFVRLKAIFGALKIDGGSVASVRKTLDRASALS